MAPEVVGAPVSERREPAPGKLSGYSATSISLAPAAANWSLELDEGNDRLRASLQAEFSYDQPPAELRAGDTVSLRISGTLSGHVYGMYHTPSVTLAVGADSSVPLKNGVLGLHNRNLPNIPDPERYPQYSLYEGSISEVKEATMVMPENAGDEFAISAHFYGQSVIWRYRVVAEAADSLPISLCPEGDRLRQVLDELDKLNRIKGNPALYEAEVGFANEPFEICIADGQATLKGEPQDLEKAAGFAAMLLSAYAGAAGETTSVIGAFAAGDTGGYFGDKAGTLAADAIRAAGSRASIQAIRDSARRAEVAGELAKSGVSQVFSDYTPEKIGESLATNPTGTAQGSFLDQMLGGNLVVPAEQGLAIFREMQLVNEIARRNARDYYCSLQRAQFGLMLDIRDTVLTLDSNTDPACAAAVDPERDSLEFEFRKIRHDLVTAASKVGWDREFGYNWTLATKYQGYACTRELAAHAKNQRFYK